MNKSEIVNALNKCYSDLTQVFVRGRDTILVGNTLLGLQGVIYAVEQLDVKEPGNKEKE